MPGRAHHAQKAAQGVPYQESLLTGLVHLALGELLKLGDKVRPVVTDRVTRVVAIFVDGLDGEPARAQALEQDVVRGSGEAVGVGKDDEGHKLFLNQAFIWMRDLFQWL